MSLQLSGLLLILLSTLLGQGTQGEASNTLCAEKKNTKTPKTKIKIKNIFIQSPYLPAF